MEPDHGLTLDCPLNSCSLIPCATRDTTLAKWFHLHMQWLLDEVCNTIRVSSRSSPQTNDVQRVPSYESLDLQANVLSLRFFFTKQNFIWRCGRKMCHMWDRCKTLLLEYGLAAESHVPRHKLIQWQTITAPSPQTVISHSFIPSILGNVRTTNPPLLTC